jgi:hypothetical protein
MLIIFDVKGIVHKEFVLAGQTVDSANYCDFLRRLLENVQRLLPEIWRQKNWLLHHDNAPLRIFFFQQGMFNRKQHDCRLTWPPANFLFSRLKGRHFYTIEVMEVESQSALNTLTEHDLRRISQKGTISREIVQPNGSSSRGKYGWM